MPSEVEGGAVPTASKGSWTSFLKSIASFNGDLSSLTAPAFILSSQSLVEFSGCWAENQALFLAPASESDPQKRALLVLRWLINTLHQQFCSRSEKYGNEKKPLNPFLGELFLGHWDAPDGSKTTLISEQVSHHPPVTAYCVENAQHKIQIQGYNGQKASFSRTIHVKQIGHSILTLYPPGSSAPEVYLITLPPLHVENLIYGAPFVEIEKFAHLSSSSGFTAKIDYSGKGWLSGKKNSFTAMMWSENDKKSSEKHPLYSLDGQWSDTFAIREGDGGKKSNALETISSADVKLSPLIVAPIDEQDMLESRRAWQGVAKGIEKGDMDATSAHKTRVETAQRALRRKEEQEGRSWKRVFFSQPTNGQEDGWEKTVHGLIKHVSSNLGPSNWDGLQPEKTGGIWRFDKSKAQAASKPYHEDAAEALGLQGDAVSR
ncbi:Oxysterol-binding protein 4, partial [Elasticomyces elasticus]